MSNQATNTPSEPVLCKLGCGFFGNTATNDCCSKCWRELQKKEGNDSASPVCQPVAASQTVAESEPAPMEVETPAPVAAAEPVADVQMNEVEKKPEEKKRKKKKKTSYKAMMASMTKRTKDDSDIQKEKEGLRKVTGGGAFQKIEKI